MTKTINNWLPVVKSFLNICAAHGLKIQKVDDGEEDTLTDNVNEAAKAVCAVDEASVYLLTPEGKRLWVFIVLGNSPEETICDHTCNPLLEKAAEEFSSKWEGKNVPTKEITR
jgi:hypothetical protein